MTENDIAHIVINQAYYLHRKIGPGLLESVYEEILAGLLRRQSLSIERQVSLHVDFEDIHVSNAFRVDLIVQGLVIVELKSVNELLDIHRRQLLTYLRASQLKLGLLLNFNEVLLKNGICRVVNGLPEEPLRVVPIPHTKNH